MSFLQLVFSLDKTFEEIILFWRICHLDIFTDTCLTDITTIATCGDTLSSFVLHSAHTELSKISIHAGTNNIKAESSLV